MAECWTSRNHKFVVAERLCFSCTKDLYEILLRSPSVWTPSVAYRTEECLMLDSILLYHSNNVKIHTHTRLMALFPGLPRWASTRKVKPIWILLKQETVSGSGISWTICKSAPCSKQITMPAPHRSVFFIGRMPFLPPNQQCQSTEGKIHTHIRRKYIHTHQVKTDKTRKLLSIKDRFTELSFYVPLDTKSVISETFCPANLLAWYGKQLKVTQQKPALTDQKKCTTTQNKHKKTKARFSRLLRHPAWKSSVQR